MSFVGTRPEVPDYVRQYTPQMRAHVAAAGGGHLHGLQSSSRTRPRSWRSLRRARTRTVTQVLPAKMRLNLRDVRDFSIGRDLRIAFRTIFGGRDMRRETTTR